MTESLFQFLRGPDSVWRYLRGRWRLHRAARRYLREVNRG